MQNQIATTEEKRFKPVQSRIFLRVLSVLRGGEVDSATRSACVQDVQLPGALPLVGSAAVILAAAIVASVLPAARAARVDVMQALRSE